MSIVSVWNRALDLVPARAQVSDPGEESREARACSRWYDTVRKTTLRAAFWDSATAYVNLGLIATLEDFGASWTEAQPDPQWMYAYTYPSDCLQARYLTTYEKFATSVQNKNVKVILTNVERPILVYTFDVTNTALWDIDLEQAIVFALAAHIAPGLSGKTRRSVDLLDQANSIILDAQATNANEHSDQHESLPDWLQARGAALDFPERFVVQHGPVFTTRYIALSNFNGTTASI